MRSFKLDPDKTAALPDPAVLRQAANDRAAEIAFQQAYQYLSRKQFAQARKALQDLQVSHRGNPHVAKLQQRIFVLEAEERARAEGLRTWRYRLGMNTTWRRICWGAAAVFLVAYSLSQSPQAIAYAVKNGIAASITSQVNWRGRYGSSRSFDWTRPILIDLLYQALILAGAAAIILVLIRVSRGAAHWEELDPGDFQEGF